LLFGKLKSKSEKLKKHFPFLNKEDELKMKGIKLIQNEESKDGKSHLFFKWNDNNISEYKYDKYENKKYEILHF